MGNTVSEALAAWILAFLMLGAGFSVLAFHVPHVRDGVVVPVWSAPPVAGKEDWDDPECRHGAMSCTDLAEAASSEDPIRAPSLGGVGW
jgi:hypothetical protein